jgi:hypothetical protein
MTVTFTDITKWIERCSEQKYELSQWGNEAGLHIAARKVGVSSCQPSEVHTDCMMKFFIGPARLYLAFPD